MPMTATWYDFVRGFLKPANQVRDDNKLTMEGLRNVLKAPPYGYQEVFARATVDLTAAGAKFVTTGIVIPAYSLVVYAGIYIDTLVVAGGTTVKVGLGLQGSATNKYGHTGDLLALTELYRCYATVTTTSETIDVSGVTTAGNALGDTNVSAGVVKVAMIYYKPLAMSAFPAVYSP